MPGNRHSAWAGKLFVVPFLFKHPSEGVKRVAPLVRPAPRGPPARFTTPAARPPASQRPLHNARFTNARFTTPLHNARFIIRRRVGARRS